jgi:hypothetical protein
MGTNGGPNNKQLALKGMVTKEKQELNNIKGTDERYELKQLPTSSTQLLEYNPTRNNDEGICNVYLQHHPIKVNILRCPNFVHHNLTTSLNYNPKLVGG